MEITLFQRIAEVLVKISEVDSIRRLVNGVGSGGCSEFGLGVVFDIGSRYGSSVGKTTKGKFYVRVCDSVS